MSLTLEITTCVKKEPEERNDHNLSVCNVSLCVVSGKGLLNYILWEDEEIKAENHYTTCPRITHTLRGLGFPLTRFPCTPGAHRPILRGF